MNLTEKIESPIEQKLYDAVSPWLKNSARILPQVEVQTKRGLRRLDFLLSDGTVAAVVECDGRDYHDFDSDLERDVALFVVGAQIIFHFSGSFIHHHAKIIPPMLSYFLPEFFIENADLSAPCPLPTDGAYVRIAPTFPGLRPEMMERVLDGWSIGILSTCHNLSRIPVSPRLLQIIQEHEAAEAKERVRAAREALLVKLKNGGQL